MMATFISGSENSQAVDAILGSDDPIECAVAFWGEDAIKYFKQGRDFRIICNLQSGATNPKFIQSIQKLGGEKIRTNPYLHAKVYVGPDTAIVTSSNASANGLSYEDKEAQGWMEAGTLFKDSKEIKRINEWFERTWAESEEIDQAMLNRAKELWKKRRKVPRHFKSQSLLEALRENPSQFKDRDIYFAIWAEEASVEATLKFEEVQGELGENIDFFQNWPSLPEDAYLMEIYKGPGDKFEFQQILKTPDKKIEVKVDNAEGDMLTICFKRRGKIGGYRLSQKEKKEIEAKASAIYSKGRAKDEARLLSLYDARDIFRN